MDILLTFHQFLLLGTSISAIPSNVFEGFAIFTRITSKPLSNCLRTSKSTPTGVQNDSRSLPRRSQGGPESSQDWLKRSQDRPKRPYDRPQRSPWATLGRLLDDSWTTFGRLWAALLQNFNQRLPLDRYFDYFSSTPAPRNLHFCNTFLCF